MLRCNPAAILDKWLRGCALPVEKTIGFILSSQLLDTALVVIAAAMATRMGEDSVRGSGKGEALVLLRRVRFPGAILV